MIDVALKVGELTGGMAEGSVVTFLTKPQPLSRNMKTVFAMLRMDESQLPAIMEAMRSTDKRPRRLRIPLRALSHALSCPKLEKRWRGPEPVEPVDVSRLDLRKIMRRGYMVKRPKHPDLNAISSGTRTVGLAGAYANWDAALADIATSISGVLTFIQISHLSYSLAGVTPQITFNNPNARIIFKSASLLKGNADAGLQIEDTTRGATGFKIRVRAAAGSEGAYVEVKDLYFKTALSANPASPHPLLEIEGWGAAGEEAVHKIHDCIFNGNTVMGYGFRKPADKEILHMWNCKFNAFIIHDAISLPVACSTSSFIENCSFIGNNNDINLGADGNVKINNCVAMNTTGTAFIIPTPQGSDGDNNVSEDASAADFNGTNNLPNQVSLSTEFYNGAPESPGYLRLLATATVIPSAGKAPEIEDNDAGSIGNSRPGTDGEYSAGADELEEVLPDSWNLYTKLTISADKVTGASPYMMPVLITEKAFMITDEIWINSREDGGDLRITTDAEGQSMKALEVVTWDRANRKCELWALITVDPDDDTEIYLWAGNPHAAQPEFNDDRDYRGQFGVWQYDTAMQGFVLHCRNDPQERYAYDSSAYKAHAPIASSVMTQIDSPWGYGKALKFDDAVSRYLNYDIYSEFTGAESHGFALMHVQKINTGDCDLMCLDNNAGTKRRFRFEDRAFTQGFSVSGTSPDGGITRVEESNILLSDLEPHVLGGVVDLPADRIDAWVDGVKTSSSVTFGATNFSSGTHTPADIGKSRSGDPALFYGQEIRYMSKDSFGAFELDGFWQTHYTMVTDQLGFWSCGDLYGQSQEGPRKWQFLVPEVGCFGIENTDFWVEYTANVDGTLSAILHAVWDAGSHRDLTGLAKRVELEGRLEELRHTFETLRGDLLIDAGTAFEKLIRGVQLSGVTLNEGKTNAALDYDVTFVIGLAGLGMRGIARDLEFGASVLNAANFLVEYAGSDGTVFKDVFRAAPIRVPTGPTLKSVFVSAVVESVAATTPLGRRQKTEAIVKEWAWNRLGTEGELKIDGASLGTAHLASVQPSNLELPDAVVYDLEFLTGYGS